MLLSSYLIANKYTSKLAPTDAQGPSRLENTPYTPTFTHFQTSSQFTSYCYCTVPGDFEEIYGAEDSDESELHAGQWDAVLTCFFIDTVSLVSRF